MAQDLFQVLDGLQVDDDEIREAELFAVNYLQPLYPTMDLRDGTGLRDTSIRSASTLLALLRKGLTYYFTVNSLDNATDQTPEETVDALLSNFFLQRKVGTNSVVTARLYFTIRKDVNLTTSLFFSTDNEAFFFPQQNTAVAAANLVFDNSRNQYYVDVDLESETAGDQYNIDSGQLLYFTTFDPFFVGGDIILLKSSSVPRESNTDFITRSGSAISTRNLVNAPSIESRITEVFSAFSNILTVGMGEEEMLRDLRTVYIGDPPDFVDVHLGGHVDVYVNSTIEEVTQQFLIDPEINGVRLDGEYAGAFSIERVNATPAQGGTDEVPITTLYTIDVENYSSEGEPIEPRFDLGLSARQAVIVRLINGDGSPNEAHSNEAITFSMKRPVGLQSLQTFFDSSLYRVVCADLLARSYEIYELDIDINTHTGTDVTASTARSFVTQYVDSLLSGDPFVVSELMEILSRDAGIENLVTPIGVNFTLNLKNLEQETGTITSIHTPGRLQRYVVNEVTLDGETI